MSIADSSDGDKVVAALVYASMQDLLDAMHALCARLRVSSDPFGQDEYDRLGLLLPTMLGAAEELCRAADGLLLKAVPVDAGDTDAPAPYAELAQALVETRHLAKRLLRPLRPQVHEHADAIALINRFSAESAEKRGNLSDDPSSNRRQTPRS